MSKPRTAQEEKPTRLLSGISTYYPHLSSGGTSLMKGNEFTIRIRNRCIQLISQRYFCCSPYPTAAMKFLHTDW